MGAAGEGEGKELRLICKIKRIFFLKKYMEEASCAFCLFSPILAGKFICPVAVAGIKSSFFRIPVEAEDQQLSRNI